MKRTRQPEVDDRLVDKKESAAILGVSERTIERLVASEKLRKHKVRGCVRFKLSDVLRIGELQPAMP